MRHKKIKSMNKIIEEDLEYISATSSIDWGKLSNKNILITGASGILPSYMVETLLFLLKNHKQLGIWVLKNN